MSLRDLAYTLSPSWLRGPNGSRLLYAMAIQFDALTDWAAYAVRAGHPSLSPNDADPDLAQCRQIAQGPTEPRASWLARLTQWLDRWAHAGSPWGVLMAVRAWVSPDVPEVAIISNNGDWDLVNAGALCDPTHPPVHSLFLNGWDWDSLSAPYMELMPGGIAWWRVWVVIWPGIWSRSTQAYGDGSTYGDGHLYSVTGPTPAGIAGLQAQVREWKSANTWVPNIILSWDATAFQPLAWPARPDGYYGTWSKVVADVNGRPSRVPSRTINAAYLDGAS